MSALAEFQSRFVAAVLDPTAKPAGTWGAGLSVHRNTVMKGLIDVLAANYPTVERLVGAEWFQGAAAIYARAHLPDKPALALYGEQFPSFLSTFQPAQELPYLPEVARLDRLWTETHFSAEGVRIAWCQHSAVTLWRWNRPPATPPESIEIDGAAEGVLFIRPHGVIEIHALNAEEYRFLSELKNPLEHFK